MFEIVNCISFANTRHLQNGSLGVSSNIIATPSPNNSTQLRLSLLGKCQNSFQDLIGHTSQISCLCFGNDELTLATACKHSVLLWEIGGGRMQDGKQLTHRVIAENLGNVTNLAFSSNDAVLAICVQNEIWIIKTESNTLLHTYRKETDIVAVGFSSQDDNFIVSVSESKTYEIWSVVEKQLIYQSSIISGEFGSAALSQCTSLAMHPYEQMFAVGFTNGVVRVYDMSLHNSVHQICLNSSEPDLHENDDIENAVLSLKYFDGGSNCGGNDIRSLLNERLCLAIGCTKSVVLMNASTMEILFVKFLTEITSEIIISAASQISFAYYYDEFLFGVQNVFTNDVYVFKAKGIVEEMFLPVATLSVLSQDPLDEKSPLRSSLTAKKSTSADTKSKKNNKPKIDKMNQPVVFRKTIKSSGYTKDKPRSQMFTPKINKLRTPKSTETNKVGPWGLKTEPRCYREDYPVDAEPPLHLSKEKQLSESATPINDLNFSDSGKSLLAALSERSVLLIKNSNIDNISAFGGHNGSINTVRMGHTNQLIVSSSSDQTVKLWMPGHADPVMNVDHYKHNFHADKVTNVNTKDNPAFTKEITTTMFYYNDQFVLLSHGNSLCLYKYHVETQKDDLKRYQSNNRYKLVKDLNVKDTQNISTFSCINSFYSYLVLCACSNRDVTIIDMNKYEQAHTIRDAHTKPIHTLVQNQGSSFVTQPSESYELYLTAAVTDAVKLWDMRTSRCVRRFESHMNRAHKIGLAFSPCSRYIAVGSENRSVYIYDIRSSSYLHQLKGFKDVVSTLTYHPQVPKLACGTLSGQLRIFEVK